MSRLLFRDAQGRDGGVDLRNDPVYIGRGVDCAVRTDDAMVSRKHSVVLFQDGRYFIEDLDSSNGTHVNDVRVKRQVLNHNDVVRCGSLWLRYVEDVPRPPGPGGVGPGPTSAFRAGASPTATPQSMAEAMGSTNPVGDDSASLRAQLAEMQAARDQAMAQVRYLREEVVRRVRTMTGDMDRMRGELEDLLRKLGG
jgi:hypothetical protein